MGRQHALSGAVAYLATAAAGYAPATPATLAAGTLLAAGAALWPDLDHPGSTLARAGGPLTMAASRAMDATALAAHAATATRHDGDVDSGHRLLSHTLAWCVLTGAGAYLALATVGRAALALMLAAATLLVIRALLGGRRAGHLLPLLAAVAVAGLAMIAVPADPMLYALVVAGGTLVHILGDAITRAGVPMLWPIRIRGKAWYDLRLAYLRAGGWTETTIIRPVLCAAVPVLAILALWH